MDLLTTVEGNKATLQQAGFNPEDMDMGYNLAEGMGSKYFSKADAADRGGFHSRTMANGETVTGQQVAQSVFKK